MQKKAGGYIVSGQDGKAGKLAGDRLEKATGKTTGIRGWNITIPISGWIIRANEKFCWNLITFSWENCLQTPPLFVAARIILGVVGDNGCGKTT